MTDEHVELSRRTLLTAGGTVAGGTTAALGGGVVQILVSAVTVAVVGIALRLWIGSSSSEE